MRYSVTMVATDKSMPVPEFARAAEERGFHGLWLPDHTHIPVTRRTPYPPGGDMPDRYLRIVDPFVSLAMAAAVTTTLRVGTGILCIALRDPIVTAKAFATLDHFSNGRVAAGVGYGWNEDELADHGVALDERFPRVRETVLAMQRIWEDEVAEYKGEFVNLSASWSWPKPRQKPLPTLIGGAANNRVFDQIVEFGTGWIPVGGRGVRDNLPRLRDKMSAAGRDPDSLEVVPFSAGTTDQSKLDYFQTLGITEMAFDLPAEPADVVLPLLDSLTREIKTHGSSEPIA